MSKRAIIYCRAMSRDQSAAGQSYLQRQHDACLAFCQQHDLAVVGTLAEVASGYDLHYRPKLDELRRMLHEQWMDVVIVHCLGRLSRRTDELAALMNEAETHHISIYSVREMPPGETLTPLQINAMLLERERAAVVASHSERRDRAKHSATAVR